MTEDRYFDEFETRGADEREAAHYATLPGFLARACQLSSGWGERLAEIDLGSITNPQALAQLPVLRKSELIKLQAARPPFGGLTTSPAGQLGRLFMSPGPIYEPESARADFWRVGRALYAAGFRKGDILHNSFSYHLTPGGFMLDDAARAVGCAVVPGGVGNTDAQLEAMAHFAPVGYAGVPDYLKILLDRADELKLDISSLKRALVSGGPLFPSLREEYRARGILVLQCYATADLGLISYETMADDGTVGDGMVVDENLIVEIVRPGTGDPVPEGEVGEVVVTSFNPDYPMFRLATGDLSAYLPGVSPCGRTNMRLKGWLGRADQAAKVKGMFVRPEQIAEIARRHPELGRMRLIVTRENEADVLTLKAEVAAGDENANQEEALAVSFRDVTKLRGGAELVSPGVLPNDGVVIDDQRDLS